MDWIKFVRETILFEYLLYSTIVFLLNKIYDIIAKKALTPSGRLVLVCFANRNHSVNEVQHGDLDFSNGGYSSR